MRAIDTKSRPQTQRPFAMFPLAWLGVVAAAKVKVTEEVKKLDTKAEPAAEEPASNMFKGAPSPVPKRQSMQHSQAINFLQFDMLPYDTLVEICKQLVQLCVFGHRVGSVSKIFAAALKDAVQSMAKHEMNAAGSCLYLATGEPLDAPSQRRSSVMRKNERLTASRGALSSSRSTADGYNETGICSSSWRRSCRRC